MADWGQIVKKEGRRRVLSLRLGSGHGFEFGLRLPPFGALHLLRVNTLSEMTSIEHPRLEVVVFDFPVECSFADAEDFSGFFAVTAGPGKRVDNGLLLQLVE